MANEIQIKLGTFELDNGSVYAIEDISIQEKKTVNLHKIPKSDGSIAEEAKRESIEINVEGTIANSDYDALRSSLDDLKAAIHNGIQKFTMDDDRFIMAQFDSFKKEWVAFRTMIKFEITFVAHFPYWQRETDTYQKLLLKFDGADAQAIYTAETGQSVTFVGTAQLDTAQKKFGESSLLLDGNSDYVTVPDSADWNFGSDDFTIDFFTRFNSTSGNQGFFGHLADEDNYFVFYKLETVHKLLFQAKIGGVQKAYYVMSSNWSPSADTWYHIALVRSGTSIKIFIDGVSQTLTESTAISTNDLGDVAATVHVGGSSNGYLLNGWIDAVRISKGVAKWTSDFTPPVDCPSEMDQRIPTSGVGYVLRNDGNAPARVKIEITPTAEMADACKIENQTSGKSFQFRGTVNAAETLEVDNRYDTDDYEVLNNDVDSMEEFEGDFIELEPGDNTIVFTGTASTVVKITHKDTWY